VRLIVPIRIERQLQQQLAVLGDDPNAQSVKERPDSRANKTSTQADVMQPRMVAKGDHASDVGLVSPHSYVGSDVDARQEGPALGREPNALAGVRRPLARCGRTSL
jgi:hypothetical protein